MRQGTKTNLGAAGYLLPVKIELLKSAGLLTMCPEKNFQDYSISKSTAGRQNTSVYEYRLSKRHAGNLKQLQLHLIYFNFFLIYISLDYGK